MGTYKTNFRNMKNVENEVWKRIIINLLPFKIVVE